MLSILKSKVREGIKWVKSSLVKLSLQSCACRCLALTYRCLQGSTDRTPWGARRRVRNRRKFPGPVVFWLKRVLGGGSWCRGGGGCRCMRPPSPPGFPPLLALSPRNSQSCSAGLALGRKKIPPRTVSIICLTTSQDWRLKFPGERWS